MRIAILYQYYNTFDCAASGRHFTFLNQWHQQHEITLITSRTWFDQRLTQCYDWVPPGVILHQLDVPYDNAMSVQQRLLSYSNFAMKSLARGLTISKPDVILAVASPLTTVMAAALLAKVRRVPWVFEVKDLWPDFPIQMGSLTHPYLQKSLYALEKWLYRDAAHVVTLSSDMEAHVAQRGVSAPHLTTLPNGTEMELFDDISLADHRAIRMQYDLSDTKIIFYGGSYGRANAIPTLIATAQQLVHRSDIRFVFMGQGYYDATLRDAAKRLSNVVLMPQQPKHHIAFWFSLADLSLIPFIDRPVLAANSPTKFFDSLAAGTPVIVTNPGWTKRFVETHQCGWYVPPEKPGALAACIEHVLADPESLEQAGHRGAAVARKQFDRIDIAKKMETILIRAAHQD